MGSPQPTPPRAIVGRFGRTRLVTTWKFAHCSNLLAYSPPLTDRRALGPSPPLGHRIGQPRRSPRPQMASPRGPIERIHLACLVKMWLTKHITKQAGPPAGPSRAG